jgi:hypothetical protein
MKKILPTLERRKKRRRNGLMKNHQGPRMNHLSP